MTSKEPEKVGNNYKLTQKDGTVITCPIVLPENELKLGLLHPDCLTLHMKQQFDKINQAKEQETVSPRPGIHHFSQFN